MKNKNIKYLLGFLMFLPIISFGQTSHETVNKVRIQICDKLNSYKNFEEVSNQEIAKALSKTLKENEEEWNAELDKIKNSRNNGYSIFDELLIHQLQLRCPKFNEFYPSLDNYLVDEPQKRKHYLKARKFIISLEEQNDIKQILKFFDPEIINNELTQTLLSLQKELKKYRDKSILHFFWSENLDGSVIVISNQDYKNGNTNVLIKSYFKNNNDNLLDGIIYKNKAEVVKERKQRGAEIQNNIPPPPPPPPINNGN